MFSYLIVTISLVRRILLGMGMSELGCFKLSTTAFSKDKSKALSWPVTSVLLYMLILQVLAKIPFKLHSNLQPKGTKSTW